MSPTGIPLRSTPSTRTCPGSSESRWCPLSSPGAQEGCRLVWDALRTDARIIPGLERCPCCFCHLFLHRAGPPGAQDSWGSRRGCPSRGSLALLRPPPWAVSPQEQHQGQQQQWGTHGDAGGATAVLGVLLQEKRQGSACHLWVMPFEQCMWLKDHTRSQGKLRFDSCRPQQPPMGWEGTGLLAGCVSVCVPSPDPVDSQLQPFPM